MRGVSSGGRRLTGNDARIFAAGKEELCKAEGCEGDANGKERGGDERLEGVPGNEAKEHAIRNDDQQCSANEGGPVRPRDKMAIAEEGEIALPLLPYLPFFPSFPPAVRLHVWSPPQQWRPRR